MSFPAYPAYKKSGVKWLPEVPEHWDVRRNKQAFRIVSTLVGSKSKDFQLLSLTLRGVIPRDMESGKGKFPAEFDTYQKVEPGDIVFCLFDIDETPRTVGIASDYGMITGAYTVTRAFAGADPRFIYYCYFAIDLRKGLRPFYTGLRKVVRPETFMNIELSLPPRSEQANICNFLDHETARIDALIEEQQRLIELLKEKRQAVISHAVTKGLDPTVPMKDSDVEWLGEVPAHWEVTQVKRRCDLITDGAHISPETENGVYCFVSTKDVSDEGIDFEGCLRTSAASFEYLLKTGCQPAAGDVLFSKDGTIGRTIVVSENSPEFVVASSLIIIRPDKEELLSSYLDFLCQSWVVSQQVEGFVKGAGLPRLSIQNLTKVVGVFPPLEEQVLIAEFLQLRCAAASQLTGEAWRTMELLKERRSALISAAVTGKIDVRGWQPPARAQSPKLEKEAV